MARTISEQAKKKNASNAWIDAYAKSRKAAAALVDAEASYKLKIQRADAVLKGARDKAVAAKKELDATAEACKALGLPVGDG